MYIYVYTCIYIYIYVCMYYIYMHTPILELMVSTSNLGPWGHKGVSCHFVALPGTLARCHSLTAGRTDLLVGSTGAVGWFNKAGRTCIGIICIYIYMYVYIYVYIYISIYIYILYLQWYCLYILHTYKYIINHICIYIYMFL